MPGPVALVGAGEFLDPMVEFDRSLLQATGRSRPRVVILRAATARESEAASQTWADMGVQHLVALGAEVEPVLVRDVAEAHDEAVLQAVGEADLVYLSGGQQRHLLKLLLDSPLGPALVTANARGAVVVGCSAGAMVIAGRTPGFRVVPKLRLPLPLPVRWSHGLGLVDGIAVLTRYDARPEPFSALMALQAPKGIVLLGVDDGTAVVGRNGAWQVHGTGRVTVWRGRHRERFRRGDAFRL